MGALKKSLIVFLKEPRAGHVKTRLARDLGKRRAARLYRAFVQDALQWMASIPRVETRVYYAPPGARIARLQALAPQGAIQAQQFLPQGGGDLGARLSRAFDQTLAGGSKAVIAVGTDCPLLGPVMVARAFAALARKDLVLGPAADGGYYLVGLKRRAPSLFEDVPWSTARVLEATVERARRSGLAVSLLPTLRDVDELGDLRCLRLELEEARQKGSLAAFPTHTFRALALDAPVS